VKKRRTARLVEPTLLASGVPLPASASWETPKVLFTNIVLSGIGRLVTVCGGREGSSFFFSGFFFGLEKGVCVLEFFDDIVFFWRCRFKFPFLGFRLIFMQTRDSRRWALSF
jgi:hypothetical protein